MPPKKLTTQLSAFLLTLALVLALASPAHAADAPFTDVPSSHWAYKEIMEAYTDGAVNGTGANVYNPNGNVTMAQFIAILTRAFLPEWVETRTATGGAWYAANYEAAEIWGLFLDIPNNAPETEVTREAMAQIMYNFLNGMGGEGERGVRMPNEQERQAAKNKIPDFGSVSTSMGDAVATCYALGLIAGVDNSGSFAPKGRMNRAQTAVIYVRLKDVMEAGEGISAPSQSDPSTGSSSEGLGENATGTLVNGKPVTEENVLALIEEYKNGTRLLGEKARAAGFTSYVDRSRYDAYNPSYYSAACGFSGTECAKFAYAFWDDLFGDLPAREFTGHPEDIRPGDLLHFDGHWSIATTSAYIASDGKLRVQMVDGSSDGLISWNPTPVWLEFGNLVAFYTRYPK